MEIRFYTEGMNLAGIMENQTSLIWARKYFEPGSMELYAPITADNLRLTELGNLVWLRGAKEAAVIEDRMIEENSARSRIIIGGRFLSSYMDRRLVRPKVNFSGLTEVAMRKLLTDAESIPRVVLGDLNGFADTITFQATYKNLLEYEKKLARSAGIGFRFRPDFSEKKIIFELYKGTDRSSAQSRNNRVIFSEMYLNLDNVVLRENQKSLKNCVYVGGAGEGDSRTYVSFGTEITGLERRELFVDARDIAPDDMTAEQYRQALLQRGHDKLTEYAKSTSIESDTDANANFVYKTNYDLGDIVSIRKQAWGITTDLRITEIHEVYERGKMRVMPVFGEALPQTIDWSDD